MSDKRKYEDDDGRTIADMSDVSGGPLYGGWLPRGMHQRRQKTEPVHEREKEVRPWEKSDLTMRERWMYTMGALKAALIIGFCYIGGLGLIIVLLILLWKII